MQPITVFTARRFITMDDSRPEAQAVAVEDGKLVAVGSLNEVVAAIGDNYVFDETFADRIVITGLIDQHLHPMLGATTLVTEVIAPEVWDLPERTFDAALTPAEYWSRLREAEKALSDPAEWLVSWGYHSLWHGELVRSKLDEISTTRPICVWQRSCHEFYFNTVALHQLGLDEAAVQAAGPAVAAMVDLDAGHFWETGMNLILTTFVPLYFTAERIARGLHQMVAYLHSKGVTAVNEPGITTGEPWELYQEILGDQDCPFETTFLVDARSQCDGGLSPAEAVDDAGQQIEGRTAGQVRMVDRQVKLFADGAIISQLMQMRDPYLDGDGRPNPAHHGEWLMQPDDFRAFAKAYWDADWQLHIHVNGDAGLDMVLDTVAGLQADHPRTDHRTVIVHFANSSEDQVDRIRELGCVVSANPYYPVGFADKYGEVGLGPERADAMVRSASVVERGIPLSLHSDLPMGPADPLTLAWCAVNRTTPSGRIAEPRQRISVHDALKAVTIGAAHSWREEHRIGTIEVGKDATFTVLDADPYEVDPSELDSIGVFGVMRAGRWFPVSRRSKPVAAARAYADVAQVLLNDHPGAGCSCTVARAIAQALDGRAA